MVSEDLAQSCEAPYTWTDYRGGGGEREEEQEVIEF
jgi:hypothetical protein